MSRIAEQTERFEDMLEYMKKVVLLGSDLNTEERNLLSVAYKNSVGSRRTAWRALTSIQQKEESKGSKNLKLLKDYKKKIETELDKFCDDILKLIENNILQTCNNAESKVFFLKMQGDYERYISEYAVDAQYDEASLKADQAYKKATEIAEQELKTTNPVRLGLALNFSVFCYEVI
jgi:14-3-3 protein epsilon